MTITINGTTGLAGVDGSASTPAVQGGDTNTGVFFPAADTIAFAEGGAEVARFDSSGNLGIGTGSPQRKLDVTVSDTTTAQVYLRNNNASYASGLIVYNAGGEASMFRHNGGSDTSYAGANSVNIGSITNNVVGFIQNNTERARIDSSGNLLVGTTSHFDSAYTMALQVRSSTGGLVIRPGADGYTAISFRNAANSQVGSISNSSTNTSYNTSSDYRLKHDTAPMTGALAKVAALKPCTYKWNVDDSEGEGFIAHELAEVCPHAVTGEKDAVDADGKPVYQGIDTSFLVATLTAAIQEQQALIAALQADVAALKGAQA
jgi:hypothetical protein